MTTLVMMKTIIKMTIGLTMTMTDNDDDFYNDPDDNGGSHWNLLVYRKKDNTFLHFDPIQRMNKRCYDPESRMYVALVLSICVALRSSCLQNILCAECIYN